ncbi:MAG: circularly permuted type 2 ATP-grasp protein [Candidatus Xenobia bacterium]
MEVQTLFAAYQPTPEAFDEMQAGHGMRPHWQALHAALTALGPRELFIRWEQARHTIRENGMTYNLYAEAEETSRPWPLDPLPLLVSPADWTVLEPAVAQRARLVDAIVADLYGAQLLLARRALPPELVLSHAGFLRPCAGIPVPENRYLHLYAADVGRRPDGTWCVLKDRTQAPTGAGYALENRIVLARSLPEAFRDCHAERLSPFFRTLRDALSRMAPRRKEHPRIVLLTSGPRNESYFEHSYLARYLGYSLVEGGDLTVRDNSVWLKTLGGLQQVDVILRQMDDRWSDPLELLESSFIGVPGLVEAVRSGNVAVCNALGSGVVQTPALMPFLPALCRALLGEELLLSSVPTWWCGDPASLSHVEANFSRLVIKPAWPMSDVTSVFAARLDTHARAQLLARMRSRPHQFVAQEQVELSTAPVLTGEKLVPRHIAMRSYAVVSEEGYAVLPGGMARVSPQLETLVVSLQQGGGSKDVWVLSETPLEPPVSTNGAERPVELVRGGADLPSRLADNLYWLGRYVERAESVVRLMRGILVRMIDYHDLTAVPEVPLLMQSLPGPADEPWESHLLGLAFDVDRPGSLRHTMRSIDQVASTVRDRLSSDTWRILSGLHEELESSRRVQITELLPLLNRQIIILAAFSGLAFENSTRGQGLRFLELGRRLERAIATLSLLRALHVPPPREAPVLEALLEVADSGMTYRQRYQTNLQVAPVIDLLLLDETNPRSVLFQVARMARQVERLPRHGPEAPLPAEVRLTMAMYTMVRLTDADALARVENGERGALSTLSKRLGDQLPALSDALSQAFLRHAPVPRHLVVFGAP